MEPPEKPYATNTLWDRFRKEYGPRPGGRGAQARWEGQWDVYRNKHLKINPKD